jgi:hypothetical protein
MHDDGYDSSGTIYPHPALVLVPDDEPSEGETSCSLAEDCSS